MKKLLIIVITLMLTQACYVYAQPQWKFYLAFEDGIGAKDTMWFIWDTTATFFGYDTLLGEKPLSLNNFVFNVYTFNNGSMTDDTIKTVAYPYDEYFEEDLHAFNYTLPLKISWDTSLFQADYLPPEPVGWVNYARLYSDYFFWINNNPIDHDFDITLIDTVMSPDPDITDPWFWNPEIHFPLMVYMHQEESTGVFQPSTAEFQDIICYPIPSKNYLNIRSIETVNKIYIIDLAGKVVYNSFINIDEFSMDISSLKKGIYLLNIINSKNQNFYEKFIKTD
jgi:hypothetical protein